VTSAESAIGQAQSLMNDGNYQGAIKAAEKARQKAAKDKDLAQLGEILNLAIGLKERTTGEIQNKSEYLIHFVRQNIIFLGGSVEVEDGDVGLDEPAQPEAPTPKIGKRFGKMLEDQLLPDETILGEAQARLGEAIVVTDRRIFIIMRGVFAGQMIGQRKTRSWMFNQISNVEFNVGITQGYLEVQPVGGTTAIGKAREDNLIRFPKQGKYVDAFRSIHRLIQQKIDDAHKPQVASAPLPPSEPDALDQLKKLGELRDSGVITADEFDEKKRTLLDRLT
jgi:hypothetical protein